MAYWTSQFDSGYSDNRLKIVVTESNVTTTKRTINWTLYISRSSSWTYDSWDYEEAYYKVTIGDKTTGNVKVKFDLEGYKSGTYYKQASGSFTFSHSDGSFSKSVYAKYYSNTDFGTATISSKTYSGATIRTLSYSANGGSGAPSSQKYVAGGGNVTISSTKPTRTGYNFLGWSTSSSATSASYKSGGTWNSDNASDTLYAVWKKKTYTISYSANGGSGAPSSHTKTYGVNTTVRTTKPTRDGYTFVNWKSKNRDVTYTSGETITYDGDQTLVAQWRINVLTINYYSNYATSCKINGTSKTVSGNQLIYTATKNYSTTAGTSHLLDYTDSGNTIYLTRTGYNGTGYYYNSSGRVWQESTAWSVRGMADEFGVNLRTGDRTINIKAEWEPKSSKITFNAGGGVLLKSTINTEYDDGSIDSLNNNYIPSREGYTFNGYFTASSGGTKIYDSDGDCTNDGSYFSKSKWKKTGNITLYAQWTVDSTSTPIYFYDSGMCLADGFIEDSSLMFTKTGYVHYPEFVETGSSFSFSSTQMKCGELKEK